MTREEAAHIVDVAFGVPQAVRRTGENRTYHEDEIREAKNMAIKALEQEPCEDCISRQAVLDMIEGFIADATSHGISARLDPYYVMNGIKGLPPVKSQELTGHWIAQDIHNCHTNFKCSECGYIHNFMHLYGEPTADYTYCPICRCRMVEPQERSDKE